MLLDLGALQPPQESRMLLGVLQGSSGPTVSPEPNKGGQTACNSPLPTMKGLMVLVVLWGLQVLTGRQGTRGSCKAPWDWRMSSEPISGGQGTTCNSPLNNNCFLWIIGIDVTDKLYVNGPILMQWQFYSDLSAVCNRLTIKRVIKTSNFTGRIWVVIMLIWVDMHLWVLLLR